MKLSIVTTMYYSSPYLEEFYRRCCQALAPITSDYEFVLVNDGSPDDSLETALHLREKDPRVRVVDLSRNFGHHRAMMIGVSYAQGDLVFLIDCDLEEPPEALPLLYETMQAASADVIYGVQRERVGSWFIRASGSAFYALYNFLADHPIPNNVLTARLMTRRYVTQLVRHQERVFSIEGLWEITGFKQVPVPLDKAPYKGSSTYTFARKMTMAINSITAFSNKPLIYIPCLGMLITFPASLGILYLVVRYFMLGGGVEGWASLIVSIWFLGGLIIFLLGIIAIYLSVIFMEVKQRPYAIVRHVYDGESDAV